MISLLTTLVETVPDSTHISSLLLSCYELMWNEAISLSDEMSQLLLVRLACLIVKVALLARADA